MMKYENHKAIEHSFIRCKKQHSLRADMTFEEIIGKNKLVLKETPIANDRKTQLLIKIADQLLSCLSILLEDCCVLLFDKNGFIRSRYGSNLIKRKLVVFSEEILGTNGTGLVIETGQPIKISKDDYFLDVLRIFETISVPVYDVQGQGQGILGGITITSLNKLPDHYMNVLILVSQYLTSLIRNPMHYGFSDLISLLNHFNKKRYAVTDNVGSLIAGSNLLFSGLGIHNREAYLNMPINQLISIKNIDYMIASSDSTSGNYFTNIKPVNCLDNIPKYVLSNWCNLNVYGDNYKLLDLKPESINLKNNIGISPTAFTDAMIGESPVWEATVKKAQKVAASDLTVLLEGETGTGKEVLASYIHKHSGRLGPFVAIDCSALPKELALSELFGYDKGSFTGGKKDGSPGKIELANGGTLFLDEIGDMPLELQTYLLRFLETRTLIRIGATTSKFVNVRIIAATNRLTFEEVENGNFRKDLFYRLNSICIKVPPLHQRGTDILMLANYFLQQACDNLNHVPMSFDQDANMALLQYDWPGNVRELKNKIFSCVVLADSNVIYCTDLSLPAPKQSALEHTPLQLSEKESLLEALNLFGYNVANTADYLNISQSTLYRKIQRYDIKYPKSHKHFAERD